MKPMAKSESNPTTSTRPKTNPVRTMYPTKLTKNPTLRSIQPTARPAKTPVVVGNNNRTSTLYLPFFCFFRSNYSRDRGVASTLRFLP